jgi:hypothetical protein
MKSRSLFHRTLLALLFVLGLCSTQAFAVSREFAKTVPLNADGSFEINNVNGTVRIEGWDREEVEVRALKTTPERESALDQVAIEIESRPDAVFISTRYPQDEGVEVAVDYVIHVPRHAQLNRVNTVNGTLRVISSEGIGDLHTVNGNIEVYEGAGNVHAHTTNGNVYLELRHPADTRGVSADTTNGSVLLAIPAGLPADLEARCMNGNFSSELPMVTRGADQSRVIHGRLGATGGTAMSAPPIHLGTVNGTIRIVALHSTV